MGVNVEWFNTEQTIIYQQINEPFTWDDFHAQDKVIKAMVASVNHPVCLLVDVQEFSMRNAPGGILTHIRSSMPGFPPNLKQLVVIANDIFALSILRMVQRLGIPGPNLHVHAVRSLAEAQAYLDRSQSSKI